jgi:hypothetical protein
MPSLFFSGARWSVCGAVGQTHSLPSFGLRVGWCDLAMCVAVKRWHFHFTILFLSFQVYNYQVLVKQQLVKA